MPRAPRVDSSAFCSHLSRNIRCYDQRSSLYCGFSLVITQYLAHITAPAQSNRHLRDAVTDQAGAIISAVNIAVINVPQFQTDATTNVEGILAHSATGKLHGTVFEYFAMRH